MIKIVLASAMALFVSPMSAPPDELCLQLKQFERRAAHEAHSDAVKVFWNFDQSALGSFACQHRKTAAGRQLCAWLPRHVSWEFSGMLPKRISQCYGLPADQFGVGHFPTETIKIRSESGGYLALQTGKTGPENLPWLRFEYVRARQ